MAGTAFGLLSASAQTALQECALRERLSFQMIRRMIEMARDLEQWEEDSEEDSVNKWFKTLKEEAQINGKSVFKNFESHFENLYHISFIPNDFII